MDNGSGPVGDEPINTMALDEQTHRLYVGTDFGVLVSVGRSGVWRPAAAGLPTAAVSGLTLDSKNRVLYAATHGRAIWSIQLNGGAKK
jgi:ligand-binding sensor domain-containing protein